MHSNDVNGHVVDVLVTWLKPQINVNIEDAFLATVAKDIDESLIIGRRLTREK